MQERLLTIYYGIDRLPYKDENREVHYPIVSSQSGGTLITGENNTSKLVFYVGRIGGGARQWIANIKKPDGTLSYQLLTGGQSVQLSNGESDYRAELDISSLFADQIGDVFIGLQGYSGETVIVENDGTYEISGNPVVLATGTIKIKVNYAPNVLPKGETLTPTTEQQIMAALGGKIDTSSSIFVVNGLSGFDFSGFANYQTFFDIETGQFYRKTGETLTLVELELEDMLIDGTKLTTYLGQYITTTQASQSFVAKVNSASIVYGRNALNQETTYGVDPDNSYGTSSVAKRYNGQIKAPTPVANGDLANKGYVDSSIASAVEGIEEKADVSDIVGTYAELQAYDTSTLVIGDIIKVLQDSTHSNAMSYYRWLGSEDGWEYIGSEGPYPTISEMNSALSDKVDKSTSQNKVYGTDNSGSQTTFDVDYGTTFTGKVVRRDSNDQVYVPLTPTSNGQASSKKYVDDQNALNEKLANKVTSISDSSTDAQYPSAKAVVDYLKAVLQKHFNPVDTAEYPTLNDFLATTGEEGYIYLYPIDTSDLSKGYYEYIWENNAWLFFGTTIIDLSGYALKSEVVDLTSEQTVSGHKTFSNIDGISAEKYSGMEYSGLVLHGDEGVYITTGTSYHFVEIQGDLYPNADNTFDLGDTNFHWAEGYINNLYGVNYNFATDDAYTILFGKYVADNTITTLPYETISEISLSSDTTFALKSAPTGCYPEYRAIISNVGSSAINLTFTSIVAIICNDASVVISGNVLTLPAGMTLECSIENGALVAINWSL